VPTKGVSPETHPIATTIAATCQRLVYGCGSGMEPCGLPVDDSDVEEVADSAAIAACSRSAASMV
jgi:hypothetical protein